MNLQDHSARALALVLAAAAIGALILGLGFQPNPDPDPSAAADVATAEPTPTPTVDPNSTPEPTPTPTPTLTPTPDPNYQVPNLVKVLVANGTDIAGRASVAADTLIANFGYNAVPNNVSRDVNTLPFTIYHLDVYDANAREVADALGIDRSSLELMPLDPPVSDLDDAHILVILGVEPEAATE